LISLDHTYPDELADEQLNQQFEIRNTAAGRWTRTHRGHGADDVDLKWLKKVCEIAFADKADVKLDIKLTFSGIGYKTLRAFN
jgi:hypothetical protein